jgi:hypothetical protein
MSILDWFRPRWRHSNWQVRKAAVETFSIPSLMGPIARRHQTILAKIARKDTAPVVRMAAIERLVDFDTRLEIATKDPNPEVRKAALKSRTLALEVPGFGSNNHPLLVRIAELDDDPSVRILAVEQLNVLQILTNIAKWNSNPDVRAAALRRIDKLRFDDLMKSMPQKRSYGMFASSRR